MSVHSDVTVVSDEDPSLEEVIVDLMRGTGLYATIKAQVAKFIEDTGKLDPTKFICPERADENVLLYIYEYLQWVGMKQTCSMLLFESPVKIDASAVNLSEMNEPEFYPKLHKIIVQKEDSYAEEDEDVSLNIFEPTAGDVPGLSHPFSESVKSRSASQLKIADKDLELNGNIHHHQDVTPKLSKSSVVQKTLASKILSEERLINFSFEEPTPMSASRSGEDKGKANKQPLEKSESVPEPAAFNQNILDVTFTPEQPVFATRKAFDEQISSTKKPAAPIFAPDEELNSITSDDEKKSVEILNNNIENTTVNEDEGSKAKNLSHEDNEEDKISPEKNQNLSVDKNLNSLEKKSSGGKDSYANDDFDDISTSEMLSLEIEEDDTQDISVATDTFGMSDCDHIVNLK